MSAPASHTSNVPVLRERSPVYKEVKCTRSCTLPCSLHVNLIQAASRSEINEKLKGVSQRFILVFDMTYSKRIKSMQTVRRAEGARVEIWACKNRQHENMLTCWHKVEPAASEALPYYFYSLGPVPSWLPGLTEASSTRGWASFHCICDSMSAVFIWDSQASTVSLEKTKHLSVLMKVSSINTHFQPALNTHTHTTHYFGASLIHTMYCILWVNKWP